MSAANVIYDLSETGVSPISEALSDLDGQMGQKERLPVLNREPHLEVGFLLRRGLWWRDKGLCWICHQTAVRPVADHVIPRSSFMPEDLDIADRSDNLRLACWDCNAVKRKYWYPGGEQPLGIVVACSRCQQSVYGFEFVTDAPIRCFCIQCGLGGIAEGVHRYLSAGENLGKLG